MSAASRKRLDFDRLNHILIPKSRAGRERWRRGRAARIAVPLYAFYMRLSSEGRAFAAMACVASLFALEARRTDAYVLWGALTAIVGASLLFGRAARLERVRIVATAPPRITVGEELVLSIQAHNDDSRVVDTLRFTGPFLPWEGKWLVGRTAMSRIAPRKSERAVLRATFRERGEPSLGSIHAAALLPFGLALGPAVWVAAPRFLVVPKRAHVADIRIPKMTRRVTAGTTQALRVGDSRDFLGLRPYAAGDPLRDLHVKTWARTGVPIVRQYEQENVPEVAVLLDATSEASTPERGEAAIEVVCGIAETLGRSTARLSALLAHGKLEVVPPGRSQQALDRVLDVMACLGPFEPLEKDAALESIEARIPSWTLVIIVCAARKEAHERLAAEIRNRGVECRIFEVTDPAAIARGEVCIV
ncbi:MAG: DUF58 domain-containing protein [Polyangiaceae bacterium]